MPHTLQPAAGWPAGVGAFAPTLAPRGPARWVPPRRFEVPMDMPQDPAVLTNATTLSAEGRTFKAPYPDHMCPECGSSDEPELDFAVVEHAAAFVTWICQDCGHVQTDEQWRAWP